MGDSYVEKQAEIMHQLLWTNFLREWVELTLWTIPYVGPFLKWPPINWALMQAVEIYLEKPLFLIASRWGVFTSIDWGSTKVYNEYADQAAKLVEAQKNPNWDPADRKAFRDSARKLIRFNLRS